jgi:hypothetical protein
MYENINVSHNDNRRFEPADLDVSNTYSDLSKIEAKLEPKEEQKSKIETFQDNQHFYQIPIPQYNIPSHNNIGNKEKFETGSEQNHIEYTKHVLECTSCKELLMKQFNIENDRIRNEEIMELISYLIFSLFILLLIDTYAKK